MEDTKYQNTYNFALVIVKHPDGRFLLVQERDKTWWLPGGRVEHGDNFEESAIRETKEEGGIDIKLTGIIRVERDYNMVGNYVRMRVLYVGVPLDDLPPEQPKTIPDEESLQAKWVFAKDLKRYRLRGFEPAQWFPYVERGGPILPLNMFVNINDPLPNIDEQKQKIKELNPGLV